MLTLFTLMACGTGADTAGGESVSSLRFFEREWVCTDSVEDWIYPPEELRIVQLQICETDICQPFAYHLGWIDGAYTLTPNDGACQGRTLRLTALY